MYLGQQGVATILIGAHQGLIGSADDTPGRRQLSRRRRDPAALLRSQGRGAAGDLGHEEARRASTSARSASSGSTAGGIDVGAAAARVPRRADRRAGLRGSAAATTGQGASVIADRNRRDRRRAVPARRPRKDAATTQAMLSPMRDHGSRSAGLRRAARELRRRRRRAPACPRRRRRPQQRARSTTLLAAQPPWSDLPVLRPDAPGRGLRRVGRSGAHARQRDAARAARARGDARERRPHGAPRARAAVPDPRAPRRARAGRGVAAARRPAQGRVPRHARPRAAQSAGAAADRPAAAEGGRRCTIPSSAASRR